MICTAPRLVIVTDAQGVVMYAGRAEQEKQAQHAIKAAQEAAVACNQERK